jgi:hypothetical protein
MTRDIESREKELTNQTHRELLLQHLSQVKNLTPSFISSIKVYLLILHSMDDSQARNVANQKNPLGICLNVKEFLIKRLTIEINKLIRILQLTRSDEDDSNNNRNILKINKSSDECLLNEGRNLLMELQDSDRRDELASILNETVAVIESDKNSMNGNSSDKLNQFNYVLSKILVEQVSNDFLDTYTPLRKLYDFIELIDNNGNFTESNREKFKSLINDFLSHSNKFCKTARLFTSSTNQCNKNKQNSCLINKFIKRVRTSHLKLKRKHSKYRILFNICLYLV